jgi:hypothetical protein
VSACPIPRLKCRGRFGDWNRSHYRSFWLSNIDQTSRESSLWSYLCLFLTCKIFQNEVRLPHSHGQPSMLYAA